MFDIFLLIYLIVRCYVVIEIKRVYVEFKNLSNGKVAIKFLFSSKYKRKTEKKEQK